VGATNGNGALSVERYVEAFDTTGDGDELIARLLRRPGDPGILDEVAPEEFSDPNHGELWAAALRLTAEGRTPDVSALRREFADRPRRSVIEAVLQRAVLLTPDGVSVGERVERIRDARRRERLHIAGARLQLLATNPAMTAAEAHERALEALTEAEPVGVDGAPATIGDAMSRFLVAQRSVSADRVCPTPWPDLNAMLGGGLHRKRVYVVGGGTGTGKSNVGLCLAGHAAAVGVPSVVFSAEMSEHELAGRWFARTARVPLDDITGYRLGGDATDAVRELCGTPDPLFLVDRPRVSAAGVHSTTRRLMRQAGIRLVVVDYLQLLEAADKRASRQEQVGAISRHMKLLSRELDVAVVVLAQLNRGPSARLDSRPRMADLRESGQIEQDSDAVILLHPGSEPVGDSTMPTFKMELIVDKNRHGRTGSVHLDQEYEYADLT